METWAAIRARRNVRAYDERPIPAEDLDRVLEAGRLAPSASNSQRRDFVVVTDRAQLEELATVWQGAGHVATSAATVAFIVPPPAEERHRFLNEFDLGQAVFAMAVTAADLGIGSGHSSVGDQEAARRILGFPEGYEAKYLLALGYPADRPIAPLAKIDRRPFDEVVHRGHW